MKPGLGTVPGVLVEAITVSATPGQVHQLRQLRTVYNVQLRFHLQLWRFSQTLLQAVTSWISFA